jgi:hypothetical protein
MYKLPISLQHEKVVFSTTTFCIFLDGLEISLKFCILIPIFKLCEEKVFMSYHYIFYTLKANSQKTAKNLKNWIYYNVLKLYFTPI